MLVLRVASWLALAVVVASIKGKDKPPDLNVDSDPEVIFESAKISQQVSQAQASMQQWRSKKEAHLVELQQKEMALLAERLRKMKCERMKQAMLVKLVLSKRVAFKLAEKRNEAGQKAAAVAKSKEIMNKVGSGAEERTLRESLHSGDNEDGAAWLAAMETSDPEWQHTMRRHIDPSSQNHRNKQASTKQGDGGRSWRQHVTYLDNAPQLTSEPPTALIQTNEASSSEELSEPLLKEADVAAIESLGDPDQAKSTKNIETFIYHKMRKASVWRSKKDKELSAFKQAADQELKVTQTQQQEELAQMNKEKTKILSCGQMRDGMSKKITDVVISLPLSEKEKIAVEKPFLADLEAWLKCDLCEKPKPGAAGLPATPWP